MTKTMDIDELVYELNEYYDGDSPVYAWIDGVNEACPISYTVADTDDERVYIGIDNRNLVDLSKIWHDASEKPYRHKPILIQCGYPLHTYEATALSEDVIWGDFVVLNAIFRWAYINDLLPKGGEK